MAHIDLSDFWADYRNDDESERHICSRSRYVEIPESPFPKEVLSEINKIVSENLDNEADESMRGHLKGLLLYEHLLDNCTYKTLYRCIDPIITGYCPQHIWRVKDHTIHSALTAVYEDLAQTMTTREIANFIGSHILFWKSENEVSCLAVERIRWWEMSKNE